MNPEKNINNPEINDASYEKEPMYSVGELSSYISAHEALPELNKLDRERLSTEMTQEQILSYYALVNNIKDDKKREAILEEWIPRPKQLYHVSSEANIEAFEPRAIKKRHPDEPAQIFGTPSEAAASMFFVDKEYVESGSYDGGKTWTVIIGDEEKFRQQDKGGYMYTLPPENFDVNPDRGLGLYEWTSKEKVTPTNKRHLDSGLRAMLDMGVKVYIADKETFNRFKKEPSEDHIKILEQLKPITKT